MVHNWLVAPRSPSDIKPLHIKILWLLRYFFPRVLYPLTSTTRVSFFKACRYPCSWSLLGSRCQASWRWRKPTALWLLQPCRGPLASGLLPVNHFGAAFGRSTEIKKHELNLELQIKNLPASWRVAFSHRSQRINRDDRAALRGTWLIKWTLGGVCYINVTDCILNECDICCNINRGANPPPHHTGVQTQQDRAEN